MQLPSIQFDREDLVVVVSYGDRKTRLIIGTARQTNCGNDALPRRVVALWLLTEKAGYLLVGNERGGAVLHA